MYYINTAIAKQLFFILSRGNQNRFGGFVKLCVFLLTIFIDPANVVPIKGMRKVHSSTQGRAPFFYIIYCAAGEKLMFSPSRFIDITLYIMIDRDRERERCFH
jgi:hypothetical protein